jgi:hypothetical protein
MKMRGGNLLMWVVVAGVLYALWRSNRSATTQATVPYDAASGTFLTPDYAPPQSFSLDFLRQV